jgi:hypothetical protein
LAQFAPGSFTQVSTAKPETSASFFNLPLRFRCHKTASAMPCCGGLVSQHYMQSVISLIQSQANFGAALALLGHDSLITRSRNTLVSQFLSTPEATHLLLIDADISFEAAQSP